MSGRVKTEKEAIESGLDEVVGNGLLMLFCMDVSFLKAKEQLRRAIDRFTAYDDVDLD